MANKRKLASTDLGTTALWNFDEGTGTSLVDATGTYTLGLIGGVTWSGGDLVSGLSGNSVTLGGTNGSLQIPSLFDTWPSEFSVRFLWEPSTTYSPGVGVTGGGRLFSKLDSTYNTGVDCFIDKTSGLINLNIYFSNGGGPVLLSVTNTWTAGQVYEIKWDYGKAGSRLSVNGHVEAYSADIRGPGASASYNPFSIGAYLGGPSAVTNSNWIAGTIDELRFTHNQPYLEQDHQISANAAQVVGSELSGRLGPLTRTQIITPPVGYDFAIEPRPLWDANASQFKCWVTLGVLASNHFHIALFAGSTLTSLTKVNDVVGQTFGGESGNANGCEVVQVGTTFVLLYTNGYGLGTPIKRVVLASDGVTVTSGPSTVVSATAFGWANGVTNPAVYVDGTLWRCLFNPFKTGGDSNLGGQWLTGYADSSDQGATWGNFSSAPLSSMEYGTGGYNAGFIEQAHGKWWVFGQLSYLLNMPNPVGAWSTASLSTNTYTKEGGGDPVLWRKDETFTADSAFSPFDQIADPKKVELNGITYIIYDADRNNTTEDGQSGSVWMVVFNGTFGQLTASLKTNRSISRFPQIPQLISKPFSLR